MKKIYYKPTESEQLQEIDTIQKGSWVHIDAATTTDLKALATETGLDPSDFTDCLDKYELPRIEKSDENLFIFTRYPTDQEIGLYTSTFTFILAAGAFITICPHSSHIVQSFLEGNERFSTSDPSRLLITFLLKINQEFTKKIRRIRYSVLSAEKEMASVDSEDIAVLTKNEEVLNQYLSSLIPTRGVLEGIHSKHYLKLSEEKEEFIEDCVLSIRQSEELCSIVLKSIRSLRNSYQIIFTNNLHKTIKLLTSLTIILTIPTMIASVYGMNVDLPLAKNTFAFGIVMTFTAVLSIFGLWIFKKKGWL